MRLMLTSNDYVLKCHLAIQMNGFIIYLPKTTSEHPKTCFLMTSEVQLNLSHNGCDEVSHSYRLARYPLCKKESLETLQVCNYENWRPVAPLLSPSHKNNGLSAHSQRIAYKKD